MSTVSVNDAGYLHGDGVFETLRVRRGVPLFWERHRVRLERGMSHLGLSADLDAELVPRLRALCEEAAGPVDRRLRISISRGPSHGEPGRGGPPSIHLELGDVPPAGPVSDLVVVRVERPSPACLPPWVKPLSYLPFVLARREARERGGTDALMLDGTGSIAECDTANIFFSLGHGLFTPGAGTGRLEGVMRGLVIEEARRAGLVVVEGRFPLELLRGSREIFVTSSLRGVRPVEKVVAPDWEWRGAAVPGPVTGAMQEAIEALIARAAP